MMKKHKQPFKYLVFLIPILSFLNSGFSSSGAAWTRLNIAFQDGEVNAIAIDEASGAIYAGTSKAVYKSTNLGRDYKAVLPLTGSERKVNHLYINPANPQEIYAAADSGLYQSANAAQSWQKIFHANDESSRQCHWVLIVDDALYLATGKGLLSKGLTDPSSSWKKVSGVFQNSRVLFLARDELYLYIAADSELFRMDKGAGNIQKVFSMVGHEANGNGEEAESDLTEIPEQTQKRQITFLSAGRSKNQIYVCTVKGIFVSRDHGQSWEGLEIDALPLEETTSFAALDDDQLFLGSTKGIFSYEKGRWSPAYKGIETNHINFLSQDKTHNLYAATDRGVFILEKKLSGGLPAEVFKSVNLKREPSILDVHKMAIDYAEVDPRKITSWRKAARSKAWLPDISLGLDRSSTERLHWDTGLNPDRLIEGKNLLDWDVSVSWDLSELVWNPDQTSIDSRSKLMVELREDVLDQVTRLYFERRRLQAELAGGDQSFEPQTQFDKQMRIEELTALIDGFTGGWFSRKIEEFNHETTMIKSK